MSNSFPRSDRDWMPANKESTQGEQGTKGFAGDDLKMDTSHLTEPYYMRPTTVPPGERTRKHEEIFDEGGACDE